VNIIALLVIALFVAIVISLGTALFHLARGAGDSRKMARALTVRIALSLGLFILLMVAWWAGIISPHGLHH
jgi:cytochrome bd-type quinol oxidase subunit 2